MGSPKKKPIGFAIVAKNFKYYNEKLEKGFIELSHNEVIDLNVSNKIKIFPIMFINNKSALIKFHIKINIDPDIGSIEFDGDFNLITTQPNGIRFLFAKGKEHFEEIIIEIIFRNSYNKAKEIADINSIPFPEFINIENIEKKKLKK